MIDRDPGPSRRRRAAGATLAATAGVRSWRPGSSARSTSSTSCRVAAGPGWPGVLVDRKGYEGVPFRGIEAGSCMYAVGSGRYEFSVDSLPRVLTALGLPAAGSR